MGHSFTVRKMASGVEVEKAFPFASPSIQKIDLISKGKVRRVRLFLRHLRSQAARGSELVQPNEKSTKKKTSSLKNKAPQTATVSESQYPKEKMETPNSKTPTPDTIAASEPIQEPPDKSKVNS